MAGKNIFENANQVPGGAFTVENCSLDLGIGEGAIVQRVQFNIERPINFIYEIPHAQGAQQKVYYVGGRRRGQATFERVVGGSTTFNTFATTYGPLCQGSKDIVLTAKGGCFPAAADGAAAAPAASKGTQYTLVTPKIASLGASVSAQDIVIVENVTMMFLDLLYEDVAV